MKETLYDLITQSVSKSSLDRNIGEHQGIFFVTLWSQESVTTHFVFVACMHGDETSWLYWLLRFIETSRSYIDGAMITVVPCANQYWYEHTSRYDADGTDLNRIWDDMNDSTLPFVVFWREYIMSKKPTFIVTLHEDDEQKEHYAYAFVNKEHHRIYEDVWSEFAHNYPVYSWKQLYWLSVDNSSIRTLDSDGSLEAVMHAVYWVSVVNLELSDNMSIDNNAQAIRYFLHTLYMRFHD